jgi:D-3-phosphoglycerate dehydrogenase
VKILLADKLAPIVAGALADLGADVLSEPALAGLALTERLRSMDPDVIVVRSTRVDAEHIDAARTLGLVIRAGAGVNTIDLAACSGRGVYVTNCPGKNAAAVAELAIGHLINLDRRIVDGAVALREGRWDKKEFGRARGLRGRTLAVLGTGGIGLEVVRRAQAFGMLIRAWSRSLTREQAAALNVAHAESPEDAVRGADAVTVHLSLTPDTRGRIGESVFDAMGEGTYFVNTARAEVVDDAAMFRAAKERGVRLGLDVFPREPAGSTGVFDDERVRLSCVYGSHHIGASTDEAEDAVGHEVIRIVRAFRDGRAVPNCVNMELPSTATQLLSVRHADRVGVLARVLGVLREAGHNVEEMQNEVFAGRRAACARIALVGRPSDETLDRLAADADVFGVSIARS